MVWRIWGLVSMVVVVGAWIFMVPLSPAPKTKTTTMIGAYRDQGLLPKLGRLVVSEDAGHEVFEVPDSDAEERRKAMAAMAGRAPDAAPAEPDTGGEDEDHAVAIPADEAEEDEHALVIPDDEPSAADAHADDRQASAEDDADHDAGGHGGGGVEVGLSVLASGSADEVARIMGGRTVDRTVAIDMHEWGYSTEHVMVEPGEVIRLVVKNTGALPHEFMLMDGVGMRAVNYRLERADWTLLEHQAIYENPVVMPERGFEMVVEVHKPGMWMYMCMFPYHMQLGMMGMLMTAGVSMDGGPAAAAPEGLYHGVGVVTEVLPEARRLEIDHQEIEGYMPAMKMRYMVTSAALLEGVKPGDKVRFTIDSDKRAIVDVVPFRE